LTVVWWVRAEDKPNPSSEFEGKYLTVTTRSDQEHATSLEKVQLKRLGNESFLVGVAADDGHPDNWQKGLTVWIAVGDVSQITVFPTLDALKKTVNLQRERPVK
jgi:hypothetical protein